MNSRHQQEVYMMQLSVFDVHLQKQFWGVSKSISLC